jgi:uncharacterized cupin superfamily protein
MKIILDQNVKEGALRADRAWELFFESKSSLVNGLGVPEFADWLWDQLGKRAGNLNRNSNQELTVTIPTLEPDGLDFLTRLVSFWADEVYVKKGKTTSKNLWRKPIVNLFDDKRESAEHTLTHPMDDSGSIELNLMPLAGPGRSFFSVQVIEKGQSTARLHSHSAVDEYYLILEGNGTLRYNGKKIEVKRGDFISKPTGPDATSHLIADRGEKLRILDMEVWPQSPMTTKDVVVYRDVNEILMRGPGWDGRIPRESLMSSEEFRAKTTKTKRRPRKKIRVRKLQ